MFLGVHIFFFKFESGGGGSKPVVTYPTWLSQYMSPSDMMTAQVFSLGHHFWLKFNSLADLLPASAQSSESEAQHAQG